MKNDFSTQAQKQGTYVIKERHLARRPDGKYDYVGGQDFDGYPGHLGMHDDLIGKTIVFPGSLKPQGDIRFDHLSGSIETSGSVETPGQLVAGSITAGGNVKARQFYSGGVVAADGDVSSSDPVLGIIAKSVYGKSIVSASSIDIQYNLGAEEEIRAAKKITGAGRNQSALSAGREINAGGAITGFLSIEAPTVTAGHEIDCLHLDVSGPISAGASATRPEEQEVRYRFKNPGGQVVAGKAVVKDNSAFAPRSSHRSGPRPA